MIADVGQSYTYFKANRLHHAFDCLFFWTRNCFGAELIMDECVIFGALMRTLDNVLSLSFEHCENDITAIVLIPVVTLAKERELKKYFWKFRFLENETKCLHAVRTHFKVNVFQSVFLFVPWASQFTPSSTRVRHFFLPWRSSDRRVICPRGVLTPAAFTNEGQFWRPPFFCYYI